MASFGFNGPVRPNFGPKPGPSLGPLGFTGPVRPNFGPAKAPATAPAAPQTLGGTPAPPPSPSPSTMPGGSQASPLDSTFFNNLAANQFRVGNQINSLTATSQNDNTALRSALDQLAYQQPRDSLKLEQGANRTGGLFSSVYDQNLGNLQHSYETRQTAATTANAQKQAGIQSQIGALQGGVPIYNNEQYDAAVARSIKNAASNPATGQAPSVDTGTSQPAAPVAAPAPAPPSSRGTLPAPPKGAKGLPGAWGSYRALQTLSRSGGRYVNQQGRRK